MLKKIALILLVLLILLPSTRVVAEENIQDVVQEEMKALDVSEVDKYLEKIEEEAGEYLPSFNMKEILTNLASGKLQLGFSEVFMGLLKFLFKEILLHTKLLGQLIILSVICAILQNLQFAFEKGTTGKAAYAVCYLVLMTIAISSFAMAVNIGREAIDEMVGFMQVLLPILLTLLTAMGGVASAAIFHPIMVGIISLISTLIKNIIFPLIFFGAVLSIMGKISDRFQVSRLAGLFKDVSMGLIGLFMTIFLGVMAVQGIGSAVADGVALRTAKFAAGAFVPVVGGMFADALEAVVGTSLLIKNAVGIVGVIIIFVLTMLPVLKILSIAFIYKVAGALIQPIGDSQIADSLNTMGKSLTLVFAAVATVGLMFFFAITIMVGAGNLTVMLR